MSDNQESDDNLKREGQVHPLEVDERKSLGLVSLSISAVAESFHILRGNEGRIDIKITNKLDKNIVIQLISGKDKGERMILESEMTKVFSKKPLDGLIKTTTYECELWYGDKYAKLFVYGQGAPRKDNRFEVREKGIYLIEDKEFLLCKWN